MATVYADSPGAAFSQSAALDQQRVQNYLQSIAANRNAQLQGWQAAAQQAAARQAQEQQQQTQMLQLAQHAIRQQQEQAQFAQRLGFSQKELEENIRHNAALESRPNATADTLVFNKAQAEAQNAERATQAENIARYLNERAALMQLTSRLPTKAAADAANSGWGWRTREMNRNANRAKFSGELADIFPMDVLQQADFTASKTPADLRSEIEKVLTGRTQALTSVIPKSEADLNSLVTDRNGRYEPNFRVNPLLTGGTATMPSAPPVDVASAAQPAIPTRSYFRTEADLKEARLPSGTTIMLWDEKQKKYRRAMWTE